MTAPSTDLVGPVQTVVFRRGPGGYPGPWRSVNYTPPTNTMDPRYVLCTDHHVACDCREAERAEEIAEYRSQLREVTEAAQAVLAGHPTWLYDDDGNDLPACQCTGCQIVRASHLYWTPIRRIGDVR